MKMSITHLVVFVLFIGFKFDLVSEVVAKRRENDVVLIKLRFLSVLIKQRCGPAMGRGMMINYRFARDIF